MYGLRNGLGALVPCVTDCAGSKQPGYFWNSDVDQMVSNYRLSMDPAQAPYQIDGTPYWLRIYGQDRTLCQNMRSPVPTCPGAAPSSVVPPVTPALPTPSTSVVVPPPASSEPPVLTDLVGKVENATGLKLADVPAWAWAAGAGALLLMLPKRR